MTIRNEMLPKYLDGFTKHIESKGWEVIPFEHTYEVLRAKKDTEVMSIYKASRNIFLTVTQESCIAWEEYKKAINYVRPTQEEIFAIMKGV